MISTDEVVIEGIAVSRGKGEPLLDLAIESSRAALGSDRVALGSDRVELGSGETLMDSNETLNDPIPIAAVVAATFSNPDRFPSLAVKVASALGLPSSTPAFDLQMACSAYPYALYLRRQALRGPRRKGARHRRRRAVSAR